MKRRKGHSFENIRTWSVLVKQNIHAVYAVYAVSLSYLGILNEFGNNHRMLTRYRLGISKVHAQVVVRVRHIHGSTTQHIGRTHKTWITNCRTELLCILREDNTRLFETTDDYQK